MKTLKEKNKNIIGECNNDVDFTDHHSGYYFIESSLIVTIEDNKQMTNWGGLTVDGILNVDGQLIIEA